MFRLLKLTPPHGWNAVVVGAWDRHARRPWRYPAQPRLHRRLGPRQDERHQLLTTADQPENRRQIAYRISLARGFVNRRIFNYDYMFTRFDALRIAPDVSQLTVRANDKLLCEPLDLLS
jgi:hypothetical protein